MLPINQHSEMTGYAAVGGLTRTLDSARGLKLPRYLESGAGTRRDVETILRSVCRLNRAHVFADRATGFGADGSYRDFEFLLCDGVNGRGGTEIGRLRLRVWREKSNGVAARPRC